MCAFYLSDVSRGREPNRRLAFGKRLRFLALCSVSILAVTLCRFAIYLKTALCRAAPLTSRPLTSSAQINLRGLSPWTATRWRSTLRVNSPVLAVRRMLSFSALGFEFVFLSSLSELLGGAWPRRVAAHLFYQALATVPLKWTFVNLSI